MTIASEWADDFLPGETGPQWMERKRRKKKASEEAIALGLLKAQAQTPATTAGEVLVAQILGAGLPEPLPEHLFATELGREWRFDFAWPKIWHGDDQPFKKLALEIDGEVHRIRSRHRGDMVKFNVAAALGWTVLHFRPREVTNGMALDALLSIFNGQGDLVEILQRKDT